MTFLQHGSDTMLIFHKVILFFTLIITFIHSHIKFTSQHHNIIHIYIIIQQHMQLCRKKNIIIINVVEHKGTIEEKHSHIETLGLVGEQGKTHYGENHFKLFFLLDHYQMI